MERSAPTAVSLFSGAGGMDLGVRAAGFRVLACLEQDRHACATLRLAAGREENPPFIVEGDIREADPGDLMRGLGLEPGALDLLFGGPPCQSFSQIGKKKGLEDERGMLLFEMVRFAKAFQPRAVLMEQVRGLASAAGPSGEKGSVLASLIADFAAIGYEARWRLLNAAEHGVPQLRKRLFLVATRPGFEFEFPEPVRRDRSKKADGSALEAFATAGEALAGLGDPSPKTEPSPADPCHVDVTPKGDRERIDGVREGRYLAAEAHLPPSQRKRLTKKDTTKFRRAHRGEPANTLRCGEIFFHPLENRYLTPREYMRLHGYPDWYALAGPIRGRSGSVRDLDQHRQVANSVPPMLAQALAEAIKRALDADEG